jgi:hypothetical protein
MIPSHVQLVTADFVGTLHGLTTETVHHRVDTGAGWMWVFNVGTGDERALRFWKREQFAPQAVRGFDLEAVIAEIVPDRARARWQKWEVASLLRVSRQHLVGLGFDFESENGGLFIPQQDLRAFFRQRWLFASTVVA